MYAEFIKRWRLKAKYTQERLATELGFETRQAVYAWEKEGAKKMTVDQIVKFKDLVCNNRKERDQFDEELKKIILNK